MDTCRPAYAPGAAVIVMVADPLVQAEDIGRELAFAQARALGWAADPGRFVSMAHPAGAHPVTLVSADGRGSDFCPQAREFASKASGPGGHVTVLPIAS
jgi:hypothetical protein